MEFTEQALEPFGKELLAIEIDTNLSYKMPLIFRLTRLLEQNECINPSMRQLAELCARVHERGRVGEELQVGHHLVKLLLSYTDYHLYLHQYHLYLPHNHS